MIAFPDQRRVFPDQFLGLKPGGVFARIDPAQFEQLHDLAGHQPQKRLLGLVEFARLVVEHANRAERKALRRLQQRTGIKPQMRVARDQRVVREAWVQRRIRNDKQAGLQNGMGADRTVDRRLAHAKPDLRLEPLAALIDEIDDGNRRPADRGSHLDDFIEIGLARRVENAVVPQGGQAILFSTVQRRFQRPSQLSGIMENKVGQKAE